MTTGSDDPRDPTRPADEPALTRHEEELTVDKRWEGVGHARVRRVVETERVREQHPRQVERLAHERVPPNENDSGEIETLPDGSISVPLFEEQLVVTRRPVLRERVIIRKESVTEWQRVEEQLRRERVEFDTSDVPRGSVVGAEQFADTRGRSAPWGPIETKPFFLTSEFLAALLAILGLLVATLASDSLDVGFFWAAAAAVIAVYMLSRGFAKARTPHGGSRY